MFLIKQLTMTLFVFGPDFKGLSFVSQYGSSISGRLSVNPSWLGQPDKLGSDKLHLSLSLSLCRIASIVPLSLLLPYTIQHATVSWGQEEQNSLIQISSFWNQNKAFWFSPSEHWMLSGLLKTKLKLGTKSNSALGPYLNIYASWQWNWEKFWQIWFSSHSIPRLASNVVNFAKCQTANHQPVSFQQLRLL